MALTRFKSTKNKSILTMVAQHARTKNANPSHPKYQERIWQDPPPASRHRGVLRLHKAVPLFNMQAFASRNIMDILQSSREAKPTMLVQTITTDIWRQVEDCHYIELMVCFYSAKKDAKVYKLFLVLPVWWTPQIYLGALNYSLFSHSVISIERITLDSKRYASINEIHWLYSDGIVPGSRRELFKMLRSSAAFLDIRGGTLNAWPHLILLDGGGK
jgi:hypothetical protein